MPEMFKQPLKESLDSFPDKTILSHYVLDSVNAKYSDVTNFHRIPVVKTGSKLEMINFGEGVTPVFIHRNINALSQKIWRYLAKHSSCALEPILENQKGRERADEDKQYVMSRFCGLSLTYLYQEGLLNKLPELKEEIERQVRVLEKNLEALGLNHGHFGDRNMTVEFINKKYLKQQLQAGFTINTIPFDSKQIRFDPSLYEQEKGEWQPVVRIIDLDDIFFESEVLLQDPQLPSELRQAASLTSKEINTWDSNDISPELATEPELVQALRMIINTKNVNNPVAAQVVEKALFSGKETILNYALWAMNRHDFGFKSNSGVWERVTALFRNEIHLLDASELPEQPPTRATFDNSHETLIMVMLAAKSSPVNEAYAEEIIHLARRIFVDDKVPPVHGLLADDIVAHIDPSESLLPRFSSESDVIKIRQAYKNARS